jgi:HlyD family secretion protein
VDAYPGEPFSGTVAQVRLQPVVESNVVSYTTTIDVPNPELKLKPGMTATVTVEVARADDVLRVPNAALRFRPSGTAVPAQAGARPTGTSGRVAGTQASGNQGRNMGRVFVLDNGQLHPVRVETGISDGTSTAVLQGQLGEGATVVTGIVNPAAGGSQTSGSPLLPFGGRGRFGGSNNRGNTSGSRGQGAGR